MSNYEFILGIDLGTTFSAAAYVDEEGRPRVIPNAEGQKTTPSVVLIENGTIRVGEIAANQAKTKSHNVIQCVKRAIGDSDYTFQGKTPVEISAEILKKLKADSQEALGVPLPKAVITCPAYFSAIEVENTKKAGELAGFQVLEIVKEPTAAAVYHGIEYLEEGQKLLVCDLGGGTYDASILALQDDAFVPLATAGDRQLGGHDWTNILVEYVAERFAEQFNRDPRIDPAVEQALYERCEQVKRDFTRSARAVIPCSYNGNTAEFPVTLSEFEDMTQVYMDHLVSWTSRVLEKTDPPLTWDRIDHVLLVGGATRMPKVARAIRELTGQEPRQTAEADTMVALGAAVLGCGSFRPRRAPKSSGIKKNTVSGISRVNFQRTASRNLGTRALILENDRWSISNSTIIPYGTRIPAQKTRDDYRTSGGNASFFDVPVVEFDDIGADVILDTYRFDCPPGLPGGTPVQVTFKYDQSGQVDVVALEKETGSVLVKTRVTYEEPDTENIKGLPSPRAIVFALDISGSMWGEKIVQAKKALIDNAANLVSPGGSVQVGVVAFGTEAEVICPLSSDIDRIRTAVDALSPYGSTAMGDAIRAARELLAQSGSGVHGEIVLVSDGMPNSSDDALAAAREASDADITFSSLGIGSGDIDEAFLKDISPRYFIIDDAAQINDKIALLTQSSQPSTARSNITWLRGKK